uniref:Fructose-2,6-bisphosphatase TIGAR A n=1 Tax=Kryptolebias marmoratus TaxID=37003 RepID=A0A3Q3H104_KRYMA
MFCLQTAEKIMQHNSSCLGLQMVCDPLLKEKSFGVAEGGRVQDLRAMAEAAGQSFPGFTPPGGETQEQVRLSLNITFYLSFSCFFSFSSFLGGADDGVRGTPVHALVVTHGAYMCVAARYIVEELRCRLPPGVDEVRMFSLSPNAGLCRFTLDIIKQGNRFVLSGIRCVFVHRAQHVQ